MTHDHTRLDPPLPPTRPASARQLPVAIGLGCAVAALLLSISSVLLNLRFEKQQTLQLQTLQNTMAKTTQQLTEQLAAVTRQRPTTTPDHHVDNTDWHLEKTRYYLELASINTQWAHDLSTSIALLKAADRHIATLDDPRLEPVHQAISQDIQTLSQTPKINTALILNLLQKTQNQILTLGTQASATLPSIPGENTQSPVTWRDYLRANLKELRGLVVVHHQDDAIAAQFGPQYLTFLREMIRINVQQATIGLVTQQPTLFCLALETATNLVRQNFNPTDRNTQAVLSTLRTLQQMNIAPSSPALKSITLALPRAQSDEGSNQLNRSEHLLDQALAASREPEATS